MVTYRCMLPAYRQYRYTGGAGNNTHHNTLNILSGRGPCIMFNTVLLLYLFCVFGIMYCATLTRVRARRLKKLSLLIIWPPFITRRTMSALNPDRASRQRDIAIGAAVFEGPAVTLASNAGAPAAAPLASN